MRATLTYEYKVKNLEGRLMLFPLRRITEVRLPLGYMIFPAIGFLVRLTVPGLSSFLWRDLQSKQKAVGYPHSIHATLASMGTSYQELLLKLRVHS